MSTPVLNYVSVTSPVGAPNGWSKAIQNEAHLPHNYVLNFHVNTWGWASVITMLEDGSHYLVGTRPDGRPFIDFWNIVTSSYDTLIELPDYCPIEGDVQVAFREMRFGDSESSVWHTIGMWVNDRFVIKSSIEYFEVLSGIIRFGFSAPAGTTVEYTNIRIPELTTFADWTSLDPGETALGGLQRAIDGFYLKFYLRYDGSLRAWSTKTTPSVRTYQKLEMFDNSISRDTRDLKTHVRQVGAYTQAEFVRRDLVKKYGHRFTELNNPYLMTEEECYSQAERAIQRMEEQLTLQSFSAEYHPLLEVEDHITTPQGERIITASNVQYTSEEAIQSLNTRAYIYGS